VRGVPRCAARITARPRLASRRYEERAMGRLGFTEILVIVGVALLLFGAGRIGEIGKGLGEGIRNFKKGIRDDEADAPKLPEKVVEAPAVDEKKPA
jgi:sec-independent protein translocase protein TatA